MGYDVGVEASVELFVSQDGEKGVLTMYESLNCVALQFITQLLNSSIPAYICTCTLYI